MAESSLLKPLKIGNVEIKHRVAMAPLTRLRATPDHVPTPLMKEYYTQRASIPGTLIISEGTFISHAACGGFALAPGIWTKDQIEGWKTITDEVHRKGSFIYCQLFGMGRAADSEVAANEGIDIVAPSALAFEKWDGTNSPVPREMSLQEIQRTVKEFASAAENAIAAGFDGVEVHGANGYLLDQFLQDVSNHRQDNYGGSIENRSRLAYEVLKATSDAIGPERVGFRISPWSSFQGMKMSDPVPQFSDIVTKANSLKLAYLHVVEARISGASDVHSAESIDFAYKLWDNALLIAGGYTLEQAKKLVDEKYPHKDIVVVFGRLFLANPDLVFRFQNNLELNQYNRETFYSNSGEGYVDYPWSAEYLATITKLGNEVKQAA